jgi:hypothetical protein
MRAWIWQPHVALLEKKVCFPGPLMNWGPGKSLEHTLFQTKYYLHASESATSVKKYDTNIWVSIPIPMKGWLQGLVLPG